jgi:hypothetical protein
MHFNTDKHLVRIGTFLHILILGLKINKYQSVRQLVFNSYANYTTELQNLGKFGVNYFGVCSTDLRLDTSTKGKKQVDTSTQEI